jgi:hypothetical protein
LSEEVRQDVAMLRVSKEQDCRVSKEPKKEREKGAQKEVIKFEKT